MAARRVLILNFDFSPIGVCTIHRAFLLVFLDKAEQLAPVEGIRLRSISCSFDAPAVIRLNRYVNIPYRGVVLSRQNIFRRDSFTCQYCGTRKDLTIDHVIPRSKKGKSTWTNMVTACKRCNSRKSNYPPENVGLKLRKAPVKPTYVSFLRDHSGFAQEEWKPFLKEKERAA